MTMTAQKSKNIILMVGNQSRSLRGVEHTAPTDCYDPIWRSFFYEINDILNSGGGRVCWNVGLHFNVVTSQ